MTNGKYSSNQNSDDTKTFEDRDYFVHGPNVYTRGEYVFLLRQLGNTEEQIKKRTEYPSKISPFWIDLLKEGYKQWIVMMERDGTLNEAQEKFNISLFYNNSTPYSHHYRNTNIIVYTLAKDMEHAVRNADKKRVEQFLSKAWLAHMEEWPTEYRKDGEF